MCPIYKRKKSNGGFTILELIIAISLVGILLGAVTMTFVVGLSVADIEMTAGGVRKEASYSLRIISEELRQATDVTVADLHTLTFQADPDRNGIADTITYSWSGAAGDNLVRTQGTATAILANGVQDASFQYYDSANIALGPPFPVTASAVKVVQLTLQLAKEKESVKYEIKIRPRGI